MKKISYIHTCCSCWAGLSKHWSSLFIKLHCPPTSPILDGCVFRFRSVSPQIFPVKKIGRSLVCLRFNLGSVRSWSGSLVLSVTGVSSGFLSCLHTLHFTFSWYLVSLKAIFRPVETTFVLLSPCCSARVVYLVFGVALMLVTEFCNALLCGCFPLHLLQEAHTLVATATKETGPKQQGGKPLDSFELIVVQHVCWPAASSWEEEPSLRRSL